MNRALAAEGLVLKAVSPLGFKTAQRLMGPLSAGALRMLPLHHLHCKKGQLHRADGSAMRICLMRSEKRSGKCIGILWLHGGGYVLGAPEMAVMSFPRHLLKHCNCVIVAPDYALSYQKPYPAAIEDAYAALQWMKQHRRQLGIESEKLVVGGESAGGGLCAALCLYTRDRGEKCIGMQLPLYPMIDDRETVTSRCNRAPVWDTKANRAAWEMYLGTGLDKSAVPPYAAPARAESMKGLPPAISIIGSIEPFYAETVHYFRRLATAGIPSALGVAKGAYHAFDMLAPYAPVSRRATAFLLQKYAQFVKRYMI